MLKLQNYKKAYNTVTAIKVEELQLCPGIYWLRGENGAGKTTLLKSVAGLIPFEGEIEVHSINLRRQRQLYTTNVSFAEAEPVFPSFLTGQELVQFYLQTKGGTSVQMNGIAKALGIAPFLANKVSTYSSGMLKKLSLLLCFAGHPRLILLDEPFTTLDAEALTVLRDLVEQKSGESVSFLISSHQELGLSVSHQVLRIAKQTIQPVPYVAGAK